MSAKYRRALVTWEYRVFLVALVVMFLHLTEDTLVHEESGSSVGAKLGATVLNLLIAAVGAALYPVLWRRVRPLLVLAYGALALLAGWRAHVTDVLNGDAAGGDFTGTVFTLAGVVLIGLTLKLAADTWRAPTPGDA
jgi:hypothetical protein